MKIGIFTDLHANLPALQEALAFFEQASCDQIIHLGDMIGIGPYPKECLELVYHQKNIQFIMGNHDHWYAFGLPDPLPSYMNKEEIAHHRWTHQQIGENFRDFVSNWKFEIALDLVDQSISFQHYALNEERNWFKPFLKEPTPESLDKWFDMPDFDYIFYGHKHQASDFQGQSRYINLGSAGCFSQAILRLAILETKSNKLEIKKYSIPYEDSDFLQAFEDRQVPAREFIKKNLIGRN